MHQQMEVMEGTVDAPPQEEVTEEGAVGAPQQEEDSETLKEWFLERSPNMMLSLPTLELAVIDIVTTPKLQLTTG